jgi:hypothetical protein
MLSLYSPFVNRALIGANSFYLSFVEIKNAFCLYEEINESSRRRYGNNESSGVLPILRDL